MFLETGNRLVIILDVLDSLLSRYRLFDGPARGVSENVFFFAYLGCLLMDFDKQFFHSYIFGHGESISNIFRPPGPPAEPLLAV